jgi:hypothetical protein
MRDLIRRILKEEVGNSKSFTIEEIDLPDFIFEGSLNEGKTTIRVPESLINDLNEYVQSKYNWPPNIKNEWCSDIKEKVLPKERIVKYSCNKKFKLRVSKHWAERLFRPDEPEHQSGGKLSNLKILYPEKYEGINLFFDYKNSINDYLNSSTDWAPIETKNFLLSLGNYHEIVSIRKEGKGHYDAEFVTQIKGERFFNTDELKKAIRLFL